MSGACSVQSGSSAFDTDAPGLHPQTLSRNHPPLRRIKPQMGMTLISSSFPGETEQDFPETLWFARWGVYSVFQYSQRKETRRAQPSRTNCRAR